MLMNYWNRKECSPEDTIQKIKNILDAHNIKVDDKFIKSQELTYYARVFFSSFGYVVGSNGKGISKEYALASAYAEFMERLQTGVILQRFFLLKREKKFLGHDQCEKNLDECMAKNKTLVCSIFGEESNDLKIDFSRFTDFANGNAIFLPFFSFSKKSVEYLPATLINRLCSTTGLCAGNTAEEALVQGLSEIFERVVHRYIFKNQPALPSIDINDLKQFNSFSLFKPLLNDGYKVIVKDCTLGGKYPVVGILLIDPSKTKYIFNLGADPDIDIAIQRCITEIFQGNFFDKFGNLSGMMVINFDDILKIDKKWDIRDQNFFTKHDNFLKSIENGTGQIPLSIFCDIGNSNKYKSAFLKKPFNNKTALDYLLKILIAKEKAEVYVRDYSCMGFPTYRIFVPGFTEANNDRYAYYSLLKSEENLKEDFETDNQCSDPILERTIQYSQHNNSSEHTDIYMKSYCILTNDSLDTFSINDKLILFLHYFKKKDYNKSYECLRDFLYHVDINKFREFNFYFALLIYLNNKRAGIKEEDIVNLIKGIFGEEFIKNFFDKIGSSDPFSLVKLPTCPNCDKCKLKNNCQHEELKAIEDTWTKAHISSAINQENLTNLYKTVE